MQTIRIQGQNGSSRVMIGGKLAHLKSLVPVENLVVVTDENVHRYYHHSFPPGEVITIGTGEAVKTLDTVRRIYDQLVALAVDRSAYLIGIGGGIVCDIAGFVASTYLRGIKFSFVSTTLLAQVDASVGGKNGVNFQGYKNMIGTFNQPEVVICDTDLLNTLAPDEVLNGMGEIVKHAVLGDASLFSYLEKHSQEALGLDPAVIERLVYDSVRLKASIVERDEREQGERRKLNLGHTFGHAIEKTTGMPHGMAVAVGMTAAANLSVRKGLLPPAAARRIENLLTGLGLPTCPSIHRPSVLDALKRDKKRTGDGILFVLLTDIGAAVVKEVSFPELSGLMDDLF